MIYQAQTLEAAQLRIARLTRALQFWFPDSLDTDDPDYGKWISTAVLLGHSVEVCIKCGTEYVMGHEDEGYCQNCNGCRHE